MRPPRSHRSALVGQAVVDQGIDRTFHVFPGTAASAEGGALTRLALLADTLPDAFELNAHAVVGLHDVVAGICELAGQPIPIGRQASGEIAVTRGVQRIEQGAQLSLDIAIAGGARCMDLALAGRVLLTAMGVGSDAVGAALRRPMPQSIGADPRLARLRPCRRRFFRRRSGGSPMAQGQLAAVQLRALRAGRLAPGRGRHGDVNACGETASDAAGGFPSAPTRASARRTRSARCSSAAV